MATVPTLKNHAHYRSQSIEVHSLTPPRTPPPGLETELSQVHSWPEPEDLPEDNAELQEHLGSNRHTIRRRSSNFNAKHQEVLLLHAPKQKYAHTKEHPIPTLENGREMLVEVKAVGLNPIDWKAPDFGWGLPNLPCISGRDLAGTIVKNSKDRSRFDVGDSIMAISTDYRDSRKSAYQQYAVVSNFNACRIPSHLSPKDVAPLGVAFVAAVLGLGICLGVDFSKRSVEPRGPDLLHVVRSLDRNAIPQDVRAECFDKLATESRAKPEDWLAIWGGSSATGCIALQLAKLAGLKVVAVVDLARSGDRMLKYGADLLVDRLDTERAVTILKGVTKGNLRFGLDTRGKDTAALLAQAMVSDNPGRAIAHVVGLVGSPKEPHPGVVFHSVPIKIFHEAPQVGERLMIWLERLLAQRLIITPDIEVAEGGLGCINDALDRLRDGTVNGPRIVVPLAT